MISVYKNDCVLNLMTTEDALKRFDVWVKTKGEQLILVSTSG